MTNTSSWSQAKVAKEVGVSTVTVQRWLTGVRYPEPSTIRLIAVTFGWPIESQLAAIPEDGSKNGVYGMAFHEALNAWWARQGPSLPNAEPTRKWVGVAHSTAVLLNVPVGTRVATNTNEIYERDEFHGEPYWITPGQLNRVSAPQREWLPAYILPPIQGVMKIT